MAFRVLVPAHPTADIPAGAAMLEVSRGRALLLHAPRLPFAEACAQAVKRGRLVSVPGNCETGGFFDPERGELRPGQRGIHPLEAWVGKRLYRSDLDARENATQRRAQARRLLMQGRTADAYRIDRRFGL